MIDLLYCKGGNLRLLLLALCPDILCHGQDEWCCIIGHARWFLLLDKAGWTHEILPTSNYCPQMTLEDFLPLIMLKGLDSLYYGFTRTQACREFYGWNKFL